jgi:hypothetical protein
MTYDAILATRGWRGSDFDLVSPEFLSVIRHAIAAERAVPLMDLLEETLAVSDEGLPWKAKAQVTVAKLAAQKELEGLRAFVMPPDEDSDG